MAASKKAGTSTKNRQKNTRGKRRGWKKYDGDYVENGMILFRQLGLKVYPGQNVLSHLIFEVIIL